jgi:hypothetical protein
MRLKDDMFYGVDSIKKLNLALRKWGYYNNEVYPDCITTVMPYLKGNDVYYVLLVESMGQFRFILSPDGRCRLVDSNIMPWQIHKTTPLTKKELYFLHKNWKNFQLIGGKQSYDNFDRALLVNQKLTENLDRYILYLFQENGVIDTPVFLTFPEFIHIRSQYV